jgi:4-diphosphocytidyl-2-C-methyl-D-erythritol kinase
MSGRGEFITPFPALPHCYFVLSLPDISPIPDKTKKLYASLKPEYYTKGEATDKLVNIVRTEGKFNPSLLFNVFERVAFDIFPDLLRYRNIMLTVGASHVHLAGSGPTLYTVLGEKSEAEALHKSLQQKGIKSFLAETLLASK